MAQSARKSKSTRKSSKKRSGRRSKAAKSNGRSKAGADAIALLKADHREVETLFEQFKKARSDDRKAAIARQICTALNVHAAIEEEIFYPAFLEATDEEDLHHEAAIEHDGAKYLIGQIESGGPEDEYYDAKISVLSEMIKHHVNEEEKRAGMFAKARQADMELKQLGEQLQARKKELMSAEGGRGRPRREPLQRAMNRVTEQVKQ